jgi:hypothetical protein
LLQERQRQRFDCGIVQCRGLHLGDQSGAPVRALVPRVHPGQHGILLMDDPDRRFGHRDEIRVGHDQRDLDDTVGGRLEPGHLHVDPDEVVGVLGHEPLRK